MDETKRREGTKKKIGLVLKNDIGIVELTSELLGTSRVNWPAILYTPPPMIMAMASNLAAVKTFCTLVANSTLKQLTNVIKPAPGFDRKEKKREKKYN